MLTGQEQGKHSLSHRAAVGFLSGRYSVIHGSISWEGQLWAACKPGQSTLDLPNSLGALSQHVVGVTGGGQTTGEEIEQKPVVCPTSDPYNRLLNWSGLRGNSHFHFKISSEILWFYCNWHMNYILDKSWIERDMGDFYRITEKVIGTSQDPAAGKPKGLKRTKVWQHPLKSAPKLNSGSCEACMYHRPCRKPTNPAQRLHPSLRHIQRLNIEMFDSTSFFARIAYN